MSDLSFEPLLGREDAAPVLDALQDERPGVRVDALDSLLGLPLRDDAMVALRPYVLGALQQGSDESERREVLDRAGAVPLRSVRSALESLVGGEDELAPLAARTLADAGDSTGADVLLRELESPGLIGREVAARSLARIDVSPMRRRVELAYRSEHVRSDSSSRFWLSLALARAGEMSALRTLVEDVDREAVDVPVIFWGDPQVTVAELVPGPSLPKGVVAWLEAASESDDLSHEAQRMARLLLESEEPTGPSAPVRNLDPTRGLEPSDELVERAEAFLDPAGVLRDDWRGSLEALPEGERTAVGSTLVMTLLGRATDVFQGNFAVEVAAALEDDYVPDVRGLADLYATESPVPRDQIAWAASRGGPRFLVASLADRLANEDTRPGTVAFLKDAARYTTFAGPLILGGGVPSEPPRERELIEDFAAAAAAEPAMAEPTMAEPPPPAMAEPPPAMAPPPPMSPPPPPPPPVARNGEPAPTPTASTARWLQAFVYDITDSTAPVRLERAFRKGAKHQLEVAIAPPLEGALPAEGDTSIDEALGGPQLEDLPLTIVFNAIGAVAEGDALQQKSFVLRVGQSAQTFFDFVVLDDVADVRIELEVRHRQRTIQPALVVGPAAEDPSAVAAGDGIRLLRGQPLANTSALGQRSEFDAVVSVSSTDGGETVGTVGNDSLVKHFSTTDLAAATEGVERLLTGLVTRAEEAPGTLDDAGAIEGLYGLALRGAQLHDVLGQPIIEALGANPARIQLLLKTDSEVVPLELVYDLTPPTTGAGLCENWQEALRTGRCEDRFHTLAADRNAAVVCPSGFWGVSKLIERQTAPEGFFSGDAAAFDVAATSELTPSDDVLPVLQGALFAASTRVLPEDVTALCTSIRGQIATARCVTSWETWCEGIASDPSPSLLVLLTHTVDDPTGGRGLELAQADTRFTTQLNESYVGLTDLPRRVVLLLGCETAGVDRELQSFVARFRANRASLVVATICTVLAKRAPKVAAGIVEELGRAAKLTPATTAGDVLQTVRRELLARGELTALALVAYGDVDWRVTGA